jgi:hypothetical protein
MKITSADQRLTEPKRTSAVFGGKIVRCSGWMQCGQCGRAIQAADVDVRGDGIVLVCQGCHRDGLTIDREVP